MTSRSWRWLRTRILSLVDRPMAFEPWTGAPVYANRLQRALFPAPERERAQR